MSADKVIHVPFEWKSYRGENCERVAVSISFRLGDVTNARQDGIYILLNTESDSYTLYPPNNDEGRMQIEAFKLNFPKFPYYRNHRIYENIVNMDKNINNRIDILESKFITIISHLESIMICIGSRPADADNMELERKN